jgi:aspartate carbamoyltransferase catalytic subunit
MTTLFKTRDLISIANCSKEEIVHILSLAEELKRKEQPELLQGLLLGSCFFEPSTRTRLSFEAAMQRLGGKVIGFSDANTTSTAKSEKLSDTMKIISQYVDAIVIRHHLDGSARLAAEAIDIPVINGGDGTNQHPTQTLLDLFTIQECQGTLEKLSIAMCGDLKHGRTVHSLAQACAQFNVRLYFVSPKSLEMPQHIIDDLIQRGTKFSLHGSIEEVIEKVDILYMTRVQEERFADKTEYQRLKDSFILTLNLLQRSPKKNLRVMHPFPRVNEISREIDSTPYAYYFQQAKNGLLVRQAALGVALGRLS